MKITNTLIKKLNPCKTRFNNYLKFYAKKSFTKAQFMGLKNIIHEDKIWVGFRLMPKENLRFAAADIAELVLHIYEEKYPNDLRPRQAIAAARAIPFEKAATHAALAEVDTADIAAWTHWITSADPAVRAASCAVNAAAYATHAALAEVDTADIAAWTHWITSADPAVRAASCAVNAAAYATHAASYGATYAVWAAREASGGACAACVIFTDAASKEVINKRIRTIILRYWK